MAKKTKAEVPCVCATEFQAFAGALLELIGVLLVVAFVVTTLVCTVHTFQNWDPPKPEYTNTTTLYTNYYTCDKAGKCVLTDALEGIPCPSK